MSAVYLDYNATTPLSPQVSAAISSCLDTLWANPSSSYGRGRAARKAVDEARASLARLIGCTLDPGQCITFTSGGTESNYLALDSAIAVGEERCRVPHVITTNIEHVAIELPLKRWQEQGRITVTFVPVKAANGAVDAAEVAAAITDQTCLITIMLANNETGVIQPVDEICKSVSALNPSRVERGLGPVLVHSDAAQAIAKIDVDVERLAVDYLTIVGHKFYGPRIGALFHRRPIRALFLGGGQESGRRAGTENTPLIVGLGVAADVALNDLQKDREHFANIRKMLFEQIRLHVGEAMFVDNFAHVPLALRLPNTLSGSFVGLTNGRALLSACQDEVEASTGAACHSGAAGDVGGLESVLGRSGVSVASAAATLRLSVGRNTTPEEVVLAAKALAREYKKMQNIQD